MHEMAVMMGVVDQVTERLGGARIAEVRLTVGKLSGVVPDSLRFCFELACTGTSMEGAELDIDEPAGRAECRSCELQFAVDQPILLCPCGSANVHVISGDELLIRSVKVA